MAAVDGERKGKAVKRRPAAALAMGRATKATKALDPQDDKQEDLAAEEEPSNTGKAVGGDKSVSALIDERTQQEPRSRVQERGGGLEGPPLSLLDMGYLGMADEDVAVEAGCDDPVLEGLGGQPRLHPQAVDVTDVECAADRALEYDYGYNAELTAAWRRARSSGKQRAPEYTSTWKIQGSEALA